MGFLYIKNSGGGGVEYQKFDFLYKKNYVFFHIKNSNKSISWYQKIDFLIIVNKWGLNSKTVPHIKKKR